VTVRRPQSGRTQVPPTRMSIHRLHNYIGTYHKRAGLSQDEMAYLLGTRDGGRASRYEGLVRKPTLETALVYEAILDAPITGSVRNFVLEPVVINQSVRIGRPRTGSPSEPGQLARRSGGPARLNRLCRRRHLPLPAPRGCSYRSDVHNQALKLAILAGQCRQRLSSLSFQRDIRVFAGRLSSRIFRAVSIPATGRPFGSINPNCTSAVA
jgi:hypothetical protein